MTTTFEDNALNRTHRAALFAALRWIALVAGAGAGSAVSAAAATHEGPEAVTAGAPPVPVVDPAQRFRFGELTTVAGQLPELAPVASPAAGAPTDIRIAQFGRPGPSTDFTVPDLPQRLNYQYGYGSESPVRYRVNSDLNERLRDNSLVATPQLNAYVTYRPADWIEALVEVIAEWDYAALEYKVVTLPDGQTVYANKRYASLFIDQAYLRIKDVGGPFELIAGRRNFEDERRWLYDLSLDGATARMKLGDFYADASVVRPDALNLDLFKPVKLTHVNYYMLYLEHRGIEDTRLAAYAIRRQDPDGLEGRPVNLGLRAIGFATPALSYWAELAFLRGRDELSRKYTGNALDVGATYRFTDAPLSPSVTLGYAYATGNAFPSASSNHLFRQTGLESNEWRFAGISRFKVYGEALDPALSNLGIFTAGLGIRPAGNVSFDLVYHHYRLSETEDGLPASAITAQTNLQNKDVGSGLDAVLGVRGLFGVRRLGLDLRAGWFFPGSAFRFVSGADTDVNVRKPDSAMAIVAKFWW